MERTVSGRFEDKTALVTGSTRGIGAGIAKRLAREGASVVVSGRTVEDGVSVTETIQDAGGEATFVETDLSRVQQVSALVEATVERFGSVDVLVNNAAVQTETAVDELTQAEWDKVVNVSFRAYWLCAKEAYRRMEEGAIINVSSNHATLTMPKHFPYNAVKAGVNGMTRAMALDFGPGVRVNTVSPGWVAVERTVAEMDSEERAKLASKHPVGRIGDPADVAGTVSFLASEDAGYVTGAELLVDGGRTAVMQDGTLPDYRERLRDNS